MIWGRNQLLTCYFPFDYVQTLRSWGLDIDEALFLAGAPKGPILERIRPHLFFDDQEKNVESGLEHGVESAHVPYGIAQQYRKK